MPYATYTSGSILQEKYKLFVIREHFTSKLLQEHLRPSTFPNSFHTDFTSSIAPVRFNKAPCASASSSQHLVNFSPYFFLSPYFTVRNLSRGASVPRRKPAHALLSSAPMTSSFTYTDVRAPFSDAEYTFPR